MQRYSKVAKIDVCSEESSRKIENVEKDNQGIANIMKY